MSWSDQAPVGGSVPNVLQLAILRAKARGLTDRSAAHVLCIGERTVRRQLDDLVVALGVSCRPELYIEVGRRGWLDRAALQT
jgi:DNA-binding NarL/FixJ family response regulator